jgi:hypothetical protein
LALEYGCGFLSVSLADSMAERVGFELEPICRRQRSANLQAKLPSAAEGPVSADGGGKSSAGTVIWENVWIDE